METITKINNLVKSIAKDSIPKAKHHRFLNLVEKCSLSVFSSLNSAGRSLTANRYTGESRIRRAIADNVLAHSLQDVLLLKVFAKLSGYVFCSLDHSQFGPFCIAVLAVSFRKGRAIPIWCQVSLSEAVLINPLISCLEELFPKLATINPKLHLVLVMDRWFASFRLFNLFDLYGIYFIARTKSDKKVRLPWDTSWQRTPILEVSHEELDITYRKHQLRLIRSTYDEIMRVKGNTEPWFLLTNLPRPSLSRQAAQEHHPDGFSRRQILNRYAERFEIEEAFKDIKWLNRLEWQQVKKPEHIHSLLLFVFFGRWLLWWVITPQITKVKRELHTTCHPKKRLSWLREAWEHLERLRTVPVVTGRGLGVWG
ncbi:MAG: transposase [Candidatus Nomurabacteria bacterium]|jgi:hypothetical protein|nr:transposase [Candidatus Nomurabacteria bacterium]